MRVSLTCIPLINRVRLTCIPLINDYFNQSMLDAPLLGHLGYTGVEPAVCTCYVVDSQSVRLILITTSYRHGEKDRCIETDVHNDH